MSSVGLRVQYRPLRIGFCVQEGNLQDLLKIAEYNTALWGGKFNPIIPLSSSNTDLIKGAKRLVELFDIDVLFNVSGFKYIDKFIENYPELEWEQHFPGRLMKSSAREEEMNVADVMNMMVELYDRYSHLNQGDSNFYAAQWSEDDEANIANTLSYGRYPKLRGHTTIYEDAYLQALKANPMPVSYSNSKPKELLSIWHRMELTDTDLIRRHGGFGGVDFGVFIGDHTSFRDLVTFWNLRATGKQGSFIPLDKLETFEEALKEMQNFFSAYPFAVWHPSTIAMPDLQSRLNAIGLSTGRYVMQVQVMELYPNPLERSSFMYAEEAAVLADDDTSRGYASLSFLLPEPPFKRFKSRDFRQQFVYDIVTDLTMYDKENYLLKLPYAPKMNNWYGRKLFIDWHKFRIHRNRLSVIATDIDHTVNVYPVKNSELFEEIYKQAGYEAKPNSPHTLAAKITEQMGGLQGCRVFKIKGVRSILTLPSRKTLKESQMVNTVRDYDKKLRRNTFTDYENLYIEARDTPKLTERATLDFLISNRVVRTGFNPKCPNCSLRPWISLDDTKDMVVCEYCGAEFRLSTAIERKEPFYLRKSGLFTPDNHQEGVITTLLCLQTLILQLRPSDYAYSYALNVDRKGKRITDADFTILELSTETDIHNSPLPNVVGIAECKTNKEITQSEMIKLKGIKEELDKNGFRTKLIFAKLTGFTRAEIRNMKKLKLATNEIIILSDKELSHDNLGMYYHGLNMTSPAPSSVFNLDGLAEMSHAIYLG